MITATSIAELARHGITTVGVACGVFDGVHLGHQRVIETLLTRCRLIGATPVVLTFEPHPRAVLFPDDPPQRLTLPEQKLWQLARYGVQAAVTIPFTRELAATTHDVFLQDVLMAGPVEIEILCVGADWRFGRGGRGNVAYLQEEGMRRGLQVIPVDELWLDGTEVGSREIRAALSRGDLHMVERHLGRQYAVVGTVGHGMGIGRKIFSCPTANIIPAGQMLPADGVYAVYAHVNAPDSAVDDFENCPDNPSIAYIGTRPTLEKHGAERRLEVHLFDFSGDMYGTSLTVRFVERMRGDRRFGSKKELAEQMQQDIAYARQALRALPAAESRE